jgi:hypothetical protein
VAVVVGISVAVVVGISVAVVVGISVAVVVGISVVITMGIPVIIVSVSIKSTMVFMFVVIVRATRKRYFANAHMNDSFVMTMVSLVATKCVVDT